MRYNKPGVQCLLGFITIISVVLFALSEATSRAMPLTILSGKTTEAMLAEQAVVVVAQDGSGDFTSVGAAVDYLKSSVALEVQKVVTIRQGRYSIASPLILTDNWLIQGEGSPTLVRSGQPTRWMVTNEKGISLKKAEVRNMGITLRGLTFDGAMLGTQYWAMIWFLNVGNVVIEDCTFRSNLGDVVVVTWSSNVRIRRCVAEGNGGSVYFDRTDDSTLEDSRIEGPYGNRSCVDIYYARRISVLNNQLLRASRKGINMECVQDSLIKGNTIAFAKRSGISIYSTGVDEFHPDSQASTGNRIVGNRIYNNGLDSPIDRYGVFINHATRFTVYSTHNCIEGNEIFDDWPLEQKTQLYGVYIHLSQNDYNTIRNNYIYGNKQGAIYNPAPHTVIEGNVYEPPSPVITVATTTVTLTTVLTKPTTITVATTTVILTTVLTEPTTVTITTNATVTTTFTTNKTQTVTSSVAEASTITLAVTVTSVTVSMITLTTSMTSILLRSAWDFFVGVCDWFNVNIVNVIARWFERNLIPVALLAAALLSILSWARLRAKRSTKEKGSEAWN